MKASELRIGNLLMGSNDTPFVVTKIFNEDKVGINKGDPYTVSGDYPCLLPIPLTEEWLLKMNFNYSLFSKYYWVNINDFRIEIKEVKDGFVLLDDYGSWSSVVFKHVHQLQNLYHALTGQELVYEK